MKFILQILLLSFFPSFLFALDLSHLDELPEHYFKIYGKLAGRIPWLCFGYDEEVKILDVGNFQEVSYALLIKDVEKERKDFFAQLEKNALERKEISEEELAKNQEEQIKNFYMQLEKDLLEQKRVEELLTLDVDLCLLFHGVLPKDYQLGRLEGFKEKRVDRTFLPLRYGLVIRERNFVEFHGLYIREVFSRLIQKMKRGWHEAQSNFSGRLLEKKIPPYFVNNKGLYCLLVDKMFKRIGLDVSVNLLEDAMQVYIDPKDTEIFFAKTGVELALPEHQEASAMEQSENEPEAESQIKHEPEPTKPLHHKKRRALEEIVTNLKKQKDDLPESDRPVCQFSAE